MGIPFDMEGMLRAESGESKKAFKEAGGVGCELKERGNESAGTAAEPGEAKEF